MIAPLSLSQAAIAYGGTLLYPDCQFRAVSTDSRTIDKGDLFVALVGENFDGHGFLAMAAEKASGLVVSRPDKTLQLPQWVVADTTVALGQLARLARNQFQGTLLALTGSAGKTSVKEMLAAILGQWAPTLATKGNLNNHIGVPQTLFELSPEHRFAVIEMGASGLGEIAYLCDIARPNIALVNNVMPAHIEGFGSESAIAETKGAIYGNLGAEGIAIINLDDPWHFKWQLMAGSARQIGFSLKDNQGDVGIEACEDLCGEASRFLLRIGTRTREVLLRLPGRHNVGNALAAAACAHAAGASFDHIVAGLEAVQPVKGRMQTKRGRGGSRILDDSYNANPGSVKAAIDVLAARPGKRILVLGDMAELGSLTSKSHREVAQYAREKGIDQFYVTGRFADHSARGFGGDTQQFASRETLAAALLPELDANTTVLVKGSRSAAMDLLVAMIIEESADAAVVG